MLDLVLQVCVDVGDDMRCGCFAVVFSELP